MDLLDILATTSPIKSSSDDMGPPASHVLVTDDMDDAIITPDEGDSTTPDTDEEDLGVDLDAMDDETPPAVVDVVADATPSGGVKAEDNDENDMMLLKKQGSSDADEQDDEEDNQSAKTDGSVSNDNNNDSNAKDSSKTNDNTATIKKEGENGSGKNKTPVKVGTDGKPVKKRTWKKPKDKPKRPLSAYNLFFQHEREKIVHTVSPSSEPLDPAAILKKDLTNGGKPPKRRRHRKSHGKIGFAALARNIAEKWKSLDDSSKAVFEARAEIEKKRYKKELDEWNRLQAAKKLAAKEGAQQQALQAALAQQQKHAQQLQLQQLQQQLAAASAHSRGAGAGGAGGLGGGVPNDPFAPLSLHAGLGLDAVQDAQQQRLFGGAGGAGPENDHMDDFGMFGAQQQQQQQQENDLSPLTLAEASLHAANHPDTAAAASLDHHLLAAGAGMNGLDPISLDNLSSVLHSANAAAAYGVGAGGAGNGGTGMAGASPEYHDLMSQLTASGLMGGGGGGLGDLDPEMSTTGGSGTCADPFSAQLASLKAKAFGNATTATSSYTSLAAAKAAAAAAAAGLKGPPLSGSASSHLAALQQQVRDSLRKQQVQTGGAGGSGHAVSFLGATNSLRSLGGAADVDSSGSSSQQQQQQRMAALAMQQKAALRLGAGGMLGGIPGAGGEMDLAQDSEFMEFLTKLESD